MPFYCFICPVCKLEEKRLMSKSQADKFSGACTICGNALQQILGKPETRALETRDEYRNKQVAQDVERQLDDRAKQHYREHELPRIVADKGVEVAQKEGLIDRDGKGKV